MDRQPRKDSNWEDMRPLVVGAPSVAIGICIVFISALLTVAPNDLDQTLRTGLYDFALALPLSVLTLVLLFLRLPMWQAYSVLCLALGGIWWGVFLVLEHLDATAGLAFAGATGAGVVIIALNIAVIALRRQLVAKPKSREQETSR